LDLIFLFFKFWYNVLTEVYEGLRGTEERDVSNDVVLITGTGHGIGKELALQYSALGATIVGWDVNEKLNLETIKEIKSRGGKIHGYT
jgi:phosphoglycerate dehydrogenase-like enzyme